MVSALIDLPAPHCVIITSLISNGCVYSYIICIISYTGTTTVGHNQAPLRPVPFGYEEEGEYRVPIHYEATMDQMVALIGSSRICRCVVGRGGGGVRG